MDSDQPEARSRGKANHIVTVTASSRSSPRRSIPVELGIASNIRA